MKISMFRKMLLLSGSLLIIMAIIVALSLYSFKLTNENSEFSEIEALVLETSQLRLEMLVRRDSLFSQTYKQNYRKIKSNLNHIIEISQNFSENKNIKKLINIHYQYDSSLTDYVNRIAMLGLNENQGLEGTMRDRIHRIEDLLREYELPVSHIHLLQVRRREKDFIMRTRSEYIDSVHNEINRLITRVNSTNVSIQNKNEIEKLADEYLDSFFKFTSVIKDMSRLENEMFEYEIKYKRIISEIVNIKSAKINEYQSVLLVIFGISILIGILLSVIIARSITKPLKTMQTAIMKISNGDTELKVNINSNDELGELADFFNEMMISLNNSKKTIIEQQETLQKQFEDLKQMNITKDKFFSIIAHDLKNPISSFVKISDFLVGQFNDLSKDEIKEFMDEVHISAKNVYELLENLLLWSRAQRGLIKYIPMDLDLNTIIVNNINLLKINAETKYINLNYQTDDHYSVFADPNMINTVLRNLITNAIKFTPNEGKICVKSEKKNEEQCLITVSDNGVGIPEDKIKKLFELESGYTTNGTNNEKGTGLGLILCKEFIESHNGVIWCESELQKGSNFKFTVPLKKNGKNETK